MKKYISVIIGILIGAIFSVGMIYANEGRVAHGEINAWDNLVVGAENLKWENIFGTSKGKNLYVMVWDKLLDAPVRDTKKKIGQMYGLTIQEVESVINGSLTPLLNNPSTSKTLTQEDATLLASKVRDDFDLLLEIFSLQQEIDTSVTPSEIFSNGDLSDSGFDLIYDLSVIEEILFMEKSLNLVGDPFDKQLSSPVLPTEDSTKVDLYVESGVPAATLGTKTSGLTVDDEGEASLTIGDKKVYVGVLENDICPAEDDLSAVLDDYEEENADFGEDDDGEGEGAEGTEGDGEDEDEEEEADEDDEGTEIEAAPADEWKKAFCPGISSAPSTGAAAGNTFGDAGFSSLGGVVNSVMSQAMGAGAAFNEGGLAAYVSVCLQTSFKKKTYVSYNPGDSCVICEINKINEAMNKTLRHSLVPNKATGNLLEYPKCKKTGTLLNFQFVSIAVPIPSPPNDEIIFGNNIFNEWKKFVDRYEPFLGYGGTDKLEDEFQLQFATGGTTQADTFFEISAIKLQRESEALKEIENYKEAAYGENTALFVQKILTEIKLMNNFFTGYTAQYQKIKEQFPKIKAKETK